jgi:hypothetical protein
MTNAFTIGFAEGLGFFVLPWFCIAKAWTGPTYPSVKPWPAGKVGAAPHRPLVDEWKWPPLNKWYGNSEDGVSGQYAYVWNASNQLVPYASTLPSWLPAWCVAFAWSVWRNGANNIKRPVLDAGHDIASPVQ